MCGGTSNTKPEKKDTKEEKGFIAKVAEKVFPSKDKKEEPAKASAETKDDKAEVRVA